MYIALRTKIIAPFLQSSGIPDHEQQEIEQAIFQMLLMMLFNAVLETVPDDQQQVILDKAENAKTQEEKEQVINTIFEEDETRKEAARVYLEEEMPKIVEEIVGAYLTHATPTQKEAFFRLANTSVSSE